MGLAALLTYVSLGRRRIDYRFILLGAILPDVVDQIAMIFVDEPSGRWIGHSLTAVLAASVFVIVVFSGERRLALFGLAVGWLLHLVGDGIWQSPETFFWPAFGTDFAVTPEEPYSWDLFRSPWDHGWSWAGEVAGAAVLGWFIVAFRLNQHDRFRLFLKDGYLRP
ncbi:MAG: metal-dependent hydrolase [Actinomycetota bacterium]|nr:metal-dependent hydrolase [Actinomycetota bacterium]